ncbi:MAG: carboxypeptidase-like regulatory domain-containing protein [Bacteroidota bacterium]
MFKKIFFFGLLLFSTHFLFAQTTVTGTVITGDSNDPLIGVNVVVGEKGTITDFDGKYSIELPDGTHDIVFSYIGFDDMVKTVELSGGTYTLDVTMGGLEILKEITVVADIAIDRETPVAFSNIPTKKLEEELAGQEIPMILNSTPGAYATQSGGGDGDARITIRGFNQRNVAVMLDGIPVNDMENGWVFWSNWFGLDLVTQNMQVQRGLGASKLAIPSVGGTINILTRGIRSKRDITFKQEVGNNGYIRSTIGLSTGRLESGWGISAAGSYKQGNGWVDQAWTKGYFWYLRVDKEIGNHIISASGYGAPQKHGQRSFTASIGTFDQDFAVDNGVPDSVAVLGGDYGRRYNEFWGVYEDYSIVDGDTIRGTVQELNTRQNFYHKPQFSLRHSWNVSDKVYLSNNAYLSIGNGGGVGPEGDFDPGEDGQMDIQTPYNANAIPSFLNPDNRSFNILRANINNHFWFGLLSTVEFNINDNWTFSGGLDLRSYRGRHYREVWDLLGGQYFRSVGNFRIDEANSKLVEGDRYEFDYSGLVQWGGLFGLIEYKKNNWSSFLNVSTAVTNHKYIDHLGPKIVELPEITLEGIRFDNPVTYNGNTYTVDSPESEDAYIGWIARPTFTVKTGVSYKIDKAHAVFFNTGYLSKAQRFSNIIRADRSASVSDTTNTSKAFDNFDNELISAFELGYSFRSSKFSANLNGYFTRWNNKPLDFPLFVLEDPSDPDSDRIPVNIPGIDAVHKGIEIDFAFQPIRQLGFEGLASIGDWQWASAEMTVLETGQIYEFDAEGVHVGDAAQLQFGGLVKYEPIKGLYFKLKATWFGKNFANFSPEALNGDDAGRESWRMPDYTLFDVHAGYNFKVKDVRMGLRLNVLNVFDVSYVADARNNDTFNSPSFEDFDAKSASVFFGQGRRFNTSFKISF